jgi:hypothetical protein
MISVRRTVLAIAGAVLLVVTAGVSVWLMVSAGVFRPSEGRLDPAPSAASPSVTVAGPSFSATDGHQVLQPRDPFRPLIAPPPTVPTDTTVPGETTTTVPGETTTTVPGETTTTVPSVTTTTSPTDAPDRIRVMLLEVRTESGVRIAVVEVDDVVFTVGVGDTFAEDFRVVSLTDNGGVFTFGDSAFTLAVGQSILK